MRRMEGVELIFLALIWSAAIVLSSESDAIPDRRPYDIGNSAVREEQREILRSIHTLQHTVTALSHAMNQSMGAGNGMHEALGQLFDMVNVTLESIKNETRVKLDAMMHPKYVVMDVQGDSAGDNRGRKGRQNEHKGYFDSLIKTPMAQLYLQTDWNGSVTLYNYEDPSYQERGCFETDGNWKSVKPWKSCVRLFHGDNCIGNSLAIYPGSTFLKNLGSMLSQVWSAGPCLSTEFDFSTVAGPLQSGEVVKNVSNFQEIPDFVDMSGSNITGVVAVSSPENPVTSYAFDNSTRIKMLEATVKEKHLSLGPITCHLLDRKESIGFIIPPALGGPHNITYNTFPQSQANAMEWASHTERIKAVLKTFNLQSAYIRITFSYENTSTKTPFGFYYYIRYTFRESISYGFIRNI